MQGQESGEKGITPPDSRSEGAKAEDIESRGKDSSPRSVQVKICGLTDEDQALACARLGADAIGLVFFPRSPRHVSDDKGRAICRELPSGICTVGVFVNESYETIMKRVEFCGLRGAQLHGDESPELVARLLSEGLVVLKVFFVNGHPPLALAVRYPATACLVEAAGGPLPGGNARTWDWAAAGRLPANLPMVLAGGLDPENVREAIESANPDAVDVSSGVEAGPGIKDITKVELFISRAKAVDGVARQVHRVF